MRPRLFATANVNKAREFSEILGWELEQVAIDLPELQSLDLEEIIRAKAEAASAAVGQPVLVEDTSLAFSVWNGLPGPLIRWFLESVGNAGILRMLDGHADRTAVAQSAVAYTDGIGTHVFVGETRGQIALAPRGDKDFGWGPIFEPDGVGRTFGEMERAEKHRYSMRARALAQLHRFVAERS